MKNIIILIFCALVSGLLLGMFIVSKDDFYLKLLVSFLIPALLSRIAWLDIKHFENK